MLKKSQSHRGTKKLTFQKQYKREIYASTVEGRHNKGRPIGVLLQTSQIEESLSKVNQTYNYNARSMLTMACSSIFHNIVQVFGFLTFNMMASLIKNIPLTLFSIVSRPISRPIAWHRVLAWGHFSFWALRILYLLFGNPTQ